MRCAPMIALLLASCTLPVPELLPTLSLNGLKLESVQADEQVFVVTLGVANPNPVPLRIDGGQLALDLQGIPIGAGELVSAFSVPAEASAPAEVRIRTDLLREGPNLLQLALSGARSLDYRISGFVDPLGLRLARVNIDQTGSIAGRDVMRLLQYAQ